MKKLISVLLISAMTFSLFGCEEQLPEELPTETTAAVTTEGTTTETTPVITKGPPVTTVTEEPEIPSRPVPAERNWNVVEVSEGNEFIDFEIQKDIYGINNRDLVKDIAELAEKTVLEDKTCISDMKTLKDFFPGKLADYERQRGKVKPEFRQVFTEDYDGGGKEERFVSVETLVSFEKDIPKYKCYLVFVNSEKKAEVVDTYLIGYEVSLLNYGNFKQLIFGRNFDYGGDHCSIIGVKNGKAVKLYDFKGSIYKDSCFVWTYGFRMGDDLMYFDTVAQEYRVLMGERYTDYDEFFAMDKKDILNDFRRAYEDNDYLEIERFGDKYYCITDNPTRSGYCYTYEDGELKRGGRYSISGNNFNLNAVRNLDRDKAISRMKKLDKVTSKEALESRFIDFEYLYDYKGVTDRSAVKDIANLAEKTVSKSEDYLRGIEIREKYPERVKEYEEKYGRIKPEFRVAYTDDYDGDGKKETFAIVDAAEEIDDMSRDYYTVLSYLVYIGADNKAEVVNTFYYISEISLLNYGKSKQLIIWGHGTVGATEHTALTGVKDGKPVEYYDFRGSFTKYGCFINASGWQGCGDFMYFDNIDGEYKCVDGKVLDIDEVFAMDKTHSLDIDREDFWDVRLYGGKYYNFSMGPMDAEGVTYTYENGQFVRTNDLGIRRSDIYGDSENDMDIDKALSEMKKPTEPKPEPEKEPNNTESEYAEVSEGNEFIDFDYIKDYKGITDRNKVKELAEKAEKFLLDSDEYKQATEHSEEIKDYIHKYGDGREELIAEDGSFRAVFKTAIVEDFDGNGTTEAFVIVDMPSFYDGLPCIRSYLFYINDGKPELLDSYNNPLWYLNLLDYGKYKHLIIGSEGIYPSETHTSLYGVNQNEPVLHFRLSGEFRKYKCFLLAMFYEPKGNLMYFDTVAEEYRIIHGEEKKLDEILAMDSTNALEEIKKFKEDYSVYFLGNKYYCFYYSLVGNCEVFTYENGKFVKTEGAVSVIPDFTRTENKNVINIDMNKAEAEMKKPH